MNTTWILTLEFCTISIQLCLPWSHYKVKCTFWAEDTWECFVQFFLSILTEGQRWREKPAFWNFAPLMWTKDDAPSEMWGHSLICLHHLFLHLSILKILCNSFFEFCLYLSFLSTQLQKSETGWVQELEDGPTVNHWWPATATWQTSNHKPPDHIS